MKPFNVSLEVDNLSYRLMAVLAGYPTVDAMLEAIEASETHIIRGEN